MDELNELIEALLIDVGSEGLGATAGIGLLWGIFFAGNSIVFYLLLDMLVRTI